MKGSIAYLADDPRDTPIYSVAEAASYVGVPRGTLRYWLATPRRGRAVIEIADPLHRRLSFYNLLEAHVLQVALKRDAWLQRVRAAVNTLRERAPESAHPLLENELFTAGGYRSIFTTTVTGEVENLSQGGQLEFRQLLKRFLARIDRDATGPYQLRPYRYRHIAINHRISGGRPVIRGTAVLVDRLAKRVKAGESIDDLARSYQITRADVREASKYSAA